MPVPGLMNVCWWGLCSGPPALAAPTAPSPLPHTHTEREGCTGTDREGYLHWHFLWERVEKSPQSQKFSTKTSLSAQTTSILVLGTHICLQNQNLSKPYVIDWSAWFPGLSVVKAKLEVRVLISFLSWGRVSFPAVVCLATCTKPCSSQLCHESWLHLGWPALTFSCLVDPALCLQ